MRNAKMPCRIEEIPFLAEFIRDYFVRDHDDFTAFSSVFDNVYLQKFETQAKKIKELVAPALLTAEMKTISSQIENHYVTIRSIANNVERYANMAKGRINANPGDFGFKNLRKELKLENDEAVVRKFRELLQHIDTNSTALEATGLSKAYRKEIEMVMSTFEDNILAHARKKDAREKLVKQNIRQFDTMWNMIAEIMRTGKVIYKAIDKARVKNYTYLELIKKVRLIRMKEDDQPAAK